MTWRARGAASGLPRRQRFCDFAVSVFEEKVPSGDMKTLQGLADQAMLKVVLRPPMAVAV